MHMLQRISLLCAIVLVAGSAGAQAPATQTPPQPPRGQDMQVELTTAISAKKAKVGQTVTAVTVTPVTLAQGLVVPTGAKLIGHVRKAEADFGDAHTSLIALTFEEIQVKKGQTVPLNCFIRAALLRKLKGVMAQGSEQGTSLPPVTGPAAVRDGESGDVYRDLSRAEVAANGGSSGGNVTLQSGQVIGMPGVELQVVEPGNVSVFKSSSKNLDLDDGLQLMLVVLQQP
jgi:hypothetical protein